MERPALDLRFRLLECAVEAQPHIGIERRLGRFADVLDPRAQPGDGARREREAMLLDVRERVERRLGVARPRERAGEIARLVAQPLGGLAHERLEQAQQRPPALHGATEIVHPLGVGFRRVVDRRTRLGEDVARHRAQRLPHRHARRIAGLSFMRDYRICSTIGSDESRVRVELFRAFAASSPPGFPSPVMIAT